MRTVSAESVYFGVGLFFLVIFIHFAFRSQDIWKKLNFMKEMKSACDNALKEDEKYNHLKEILWKRETFDVKEKTCSLYRLYRMGDGICVLVSYKRDEQEEQIFEKLIFREMTDREAQNFIAAHKRSWKQILFKRTEKIKM